MHALERMPALADAGIQTFFCGPESFTPDDRYHLGEAPGLAGCWIAAGFNSIGIQSAGGAGKVLAECLVTGRAPVDLWDVDIRRNLPFQRNRRYLRERVSETLGLLYDNHWPFRQFATARGVRRSPFHDRLAARGACHGEAFGWERPNWYAAEGTEPRYEYSFGRQNWFDASAAEHRAVREGVGLFDQTSFAKFRLQGRDVATVLGRVSANEVDVPPGRIVYTQWLNEDGGIEADLTVTRLADDDYLIVTSGEFQVRDALWLRSHISDGAHAVLTDVTSGLAVLGIMGPRARDLLQSLSPDDLGSEAFPFGTSREIELGYACVRASRITYVGELGWELYIPTEFAAGVYDALVEAGEDVGLRHVGMHAMNSLRIEKAYRHYGHDIGDADTPLEAGLGFAVKLGEAGGLHRSRRAAAPAGARREPAACAVPAGRPGAPALSQRADLAGRCDRGLRALRDVRPHARRRHRPRLRGEPGRRGRGLRDGGPLRDRGRGRPLPGEGVPPTPLRPFVQPHQGVGCRQESPARAVRGRRRRCGPAKG